MFARLKKMLFYADVEPEELKAVYPKIAESNRRNLYAISGFVMFNIMAVFLLSFFIDVLESSRLTYAICIVECAVLQFLAGKAADRIRMITVLIYCFSAILLLVGIALGTAIEPNQASMSFAVLMFAVPMLFTDIPIRTIALIVISIVLYTFGALLTQTETMFNFNLSVILPYGILCILTNNFMMRRKIEFYVLERRNILLATTDQLTGMLNRRSYERKIAELSQAEDIKGVKVCAFDVNGLKQVNDGIGHHAGDELICGAAKSIETVYGDYGNAYRTGGDEFMAILEGISPEAYELKRRQLEETKAFNGKYVKELSVSVGIAEAKEEKNDLHELLQEADQEMYADKEEYYRRTGRERRK